MAQNNATTIEGTTTEQPDFLEVGSAQYDCGECGHSFLDRVYWFPDTDHEGEWLACPACGWSDVDDDCAIHDVGWYKQRYGV